MPSYDWRVTVRTAAKMGVYVAVAVLLASTPFVQWALNAIGIPPAYQQLVILPALAALRSTIVAGLGVSLGGLLGTPK